MASKNSIIAAGADGWMFRNRIINGAMRIDQRNEFTNPGPSASTGSVYSVDRWCGYQSTASLMYCFGSTNTVMPGNPGSLFLAGTSTAHTAAASDLFMAYQSIEGINVADLLWGTPSAKPVTVSFWLYAVTGGTYCVSLGAITPSSSSNYSYVIPFTVAANSTNYYQFTVPGFTTAAINVNPATSGLQLRFDVGSGTNYQTASPNTWVSGGMTCTSGCVSIVNGTGGQNILISGVQLEVGAIATPFEVRPYEVELARCQRYYEKSYNRGNIAGNTSQGFAGVSTNYISGVASGSYTTQTPTYFKVTKMSNPTMSIYSPVTGTVGAVRDVGTGNDVSSLTVYSATSAAYVQCATATSSGVGIMYHWTASAEL